MLFHKHAISRVTPGGGTTTGAPTWTRVRPRRNQCATKALSRTPQSLALLGEFLDPSSGPGTPPDVSGSFCSTLWSCLQPRSSILDQFRDALVSSFLQGVPRSTSGVHRGTSVYLGVPGYTGVRCMCDTINLAQGGRAIVNAGGHFFRARSPSGKFEFVGSEFGTRDTSRCVGLVLLYIGPDFY
jgi:hypothetical protein